MRLPVGLTLAFSLSSVAAIVGSAACSSDPKTVVVTVEGGAPDGAPVTAECAAKTSFFDCRVCCGLGDVAVGESYGKSQVAFGDCLCDGPCKEVCATNGCSLDADAGETTSECQACLDSDTNGQSCFPAAQAVCEADPACKAFQDCSRAADCDAKE